MENFGYLFAAYTIIFAVIFVYVLFIWRRQTRLDAEVKSLEQRLGQLQSAPPHTAAESRSAR